MRGLHACLKKEWLECIRGKRIFVYFGVAIGMFLLSVGMIYLLEFISASFDENTVTNLYKVSLSGLTSMYNNNMLQIFSFVLIFTLMGCVSREIKAKKWVLPICSGLKPSDMIMSKFIVQTLFAITAAISGYILTVSFGALFMDIDMTFSVVILKGGAMVVFTIFIIVLTIGLSALTKNSAISAIIPIFVLMFLPLIFEVAKISEYTPIMFYNYACTFLFDIKLSTSQILSATFLTFSIILVLIILSVYLSNKFVKLF